MPIYMNYDNLAIAGDVTAAGHEKWIEVNSFKWGIGRGISSPVGASADRESSAPSVSEVVVSKASDVSSAKLFSEALQGEGKTVQLDFCKTDKGQLEVYLSLILTNCMISGHSVNSGGDRPKLVAVIRDKDSDLLSFALEAVDGQDELHGDAPPSRWWRIGSNAGNCIVEEPAMPTSAREQRCKRHAKAWLGMGITLRVNMAATLMITSPDPIQSSGRMGQGYRTDGPSSAPGVRVIDGRGQSGEAISPTG
jgi:type VI secretion system secreted protein Hcp